MLQNTLMKELSFPPSILKKWQKLINLLSSKFDLPATLIMPANEDCLRVFAGSKTNVNPFVVGDIEEMAGFYCEEVVNTKEKLRVANALIDPKWDNNPNLKFGMIVYLGFPILYPNGDAFGTVCILDNKENRFSDIIEEFLDKFKEIMELDIAAHYSYKITSDLLEKNISADFNLVGERKKSVYELEAELEQQNQIQKRLNDKLSYFNE